MITIIWAVIWIATIPIAIYQVSKSSENLSATVSHALPSKHEKIIIIILLLLNPIICGAIFYYCWRKKLPGKARWANRFSFIAIIILIIVSLLSSLMFK